MTIEYLKTYEENKAKLKKAPVAPCSLEEISELEELLNEGKPFPKSFKEFLFIGGQYTALPLDIEFRSIKGWSKFVKEKMPKRGVKMDRPIAVFHHLDGSSFIFIYLDEGDNPQPWNCSTDEGYDSDEGDMIWKTPFKTFKDAIDKMVELAVKGLGL